MNAIDLFAGAGGFTTGARAAGVNVVWAANHWPTAVQVHAANHPETQHVCQDLQQADWTRVPRHDLLMASPSCTGHTRARGKDRPHHDSARATAWAVVSCAEAHQPRAVVVENVPEFASGWLLYPSWRDAMERLGYFMSEHVIDAADVGVPQHRRRLFIVGVRGKLRVDLGAPRAQHAPASGILDDDGPDETWRLVSSLSANTQARVAAGRRQHGERFIVAYYGAESGGRSLSKPLGTVTTKARFGLVHGDRMRMLRVSEYRRAMGFPDGYLLSGVVTHDTKMLGNAVCPPVAEWVIRRTLEAA